MDNRRLKGEAYEQLFTHLWGLLCPDLPSPTPQYRFELSRRWRADFAWPEQHVIVEIDGGVGGGRGHDHPRRVLLDMEKHNAAAARGWRVLRYTPRQLENDPGSVMNEIRRALEMGVPGLNPGTPHQHGGH